MPRFFVLLPAVAWAFPNIPTKEIAPGVHMPVCSIGTGTFDKTGDHDTDAVEIIELWLTNGGRGIDTALTYSSQRDTGDAIRGRGIPREQMFITSKIPMCMPKATVRWMVNQDLKQLNLAYIDLMLIRTPKNSNWCASTWEVLEEMLAEGTFKAIGISNFARKDIVKLMKTAKVTPALNEVQYSVFHHDDDTEAASKEYNISVHAYSPFTNVTMNKWEATSCHELPGSARTCHVWDNEVVLEMGLKYDVSPAQVAARWIWQHGNTFVFLSANRDHQANSADFMGFTLSGDDMKILDSIQKNTTDLLVVV